MSLPHAGPAVHHVGPAVHHYGFGPPPPPYSSAQEPNSLKFQQQHNSWRSHENQVHGQNQNQNQIPEAPPWLASNHERVMSSAAVGTCMDSPGLTSSVHIASAGRRKVQVQAQSQTPRR
jgi:hypothetical protein